MLPLHPGVLALWGLVCWGAAVAAAADEVTSHTFLANGVRLHYLQSGTGTPVVLLRGLASNADLNWKLPGVISDLARNFRVIALDLPGHGRSEKPADAAAYGKQVVADVVLLLDHLQIKQAHIVGYSIGGMVTLRMVADHPDRVLSATLGGMGWLQAGSPLQKFWEHVGGRRGSQTPPGFLHGIPDFALTEQELKNIQRPVTVIIGKRDPCRALYVAPLQKVRLDWPVTEIPDAGHFTCLLKPEFKTEIGGWLEQQGK